MSSSTDYEDLSYEAPAIVQGLQKMFDLARQWYSTDFSVFIITNGKDANYREGLAVLISIIASTLLLWGVILFLLKCRGSAVGCASGRAFVTNTDEQDNFGTRKEFTDLEDNSSDSQRMSNNLSVDVGEDDESFHSSLPSSESDDDNGGSSFEEEESQYIVTLNEMDSVPPRPSPRAFRTRIVFLLFGLITVACVPLVLIYAFAPVHDSTNRSKNNIADFRAVVNEVNTSLRHIDSAARNSSGILNDKSFNFTDICPAVNTGVVNDLAGVFVTLMENYTELADQLSNNIIEIDAAITSFNQTLIVAETVYNGMGDYMWAVPGILLGMSSLAAITMFGVFLAWKKESNRRFQRLLSWVILPLFIAFSLTCWVVAITAAVTAAMSTDACMAGLPGGSPDVTIQKILNQSVAPSSMIYEFTSAYTSGCQLGSNDPADVLSMLEKRIQVVVDSIYFYLSIVDKRGRADLVIQCGGSTRLEQLFTASQDLARTLTSIRKALGSASRSLSCNRVHPIYVEIVEESICTDFTSASAWGFILFLVIGISTMCMITLRASWRHKIGDDNIYDESEVAENMIVDEHEEYLAYISRYKHEWQEYKGIDAGLPGQDWQSTGGSDHSNSGSDPEIDSEGSSSFTGTGTASEEPADTFSQGLPVQEESSSTEDPFNPYDNAKLHSTSGSLPGAISFSSLIDDTELKSTCKSSPENSDNVILTSHTQGLNTEDENVNGILPPNFSSNIDSERAEKSVRTEIRVLQNNDDSVELAVPPSTQVTQDNHDSPEVVASVQIGDASPLGSASPLGKFNSSNSENANREVETSIFPSVKRSTRTYSSKGHRNNTKQSPKYKKAGKGSNNTEAKFVELGDSSSSSDESSRRLEEENTNREVETSIFPSVKRSTRTYSSKGHRNNAKQPPRRKKAGKGSNNTEAKFVELGDSSSSSDESSRRLEEENTNRVVETSIFPSVKRSTRTYSSKGRGNNTKQPPRRKKAGKGSNNPEAKFVELGDSSSISDDSSRGQVFDISDAVILMPPNEGPNTEDPKEEVETQGRKQSSHPLSPKSPSSLKLFHL